MSKNIGLDTPHAIIGQNIDILNFKSKWHASGTKVAKSGTSATGKVWEFFLVFMGTCVDTFPLRNLCRHLGPKFADFIADLPVLI